MPSALVVDTGHFLDVAVQLARSGVRTYYYVDWVSGFPKVEDWAVGYGVPGVQKVDSIFAVADEVDFILFADVGFGETADYLRRKGYAVYGASADGQRLELDRAFMDAKLREFGIPREKVFVVKGRSRLRDVIESFESEGRRAYVKISTFRGNVETFGVDTVRELDVWLDNADFGPFAEELTFVVEPEVEGVEIGADFIFDGRRIVRPYVWSPELKGQGVTCGRLVSGLDFLDDQFVSRFERLLASLGYAGSVSMEAILKDDGTLHVTDITARFPFPMQGAVVRMYDFARLAQAVAERESVDGNEFALHEFGAEVGVYSSYGGWFMIGGLTDDGLSRYGLRYAVKIGNDYWHVPQSELVVSSVALSDVKAEHAMLDALDGTKELKFTGKTAALNAIYDWFEVRDAVKAVIGYDPLGA